MMHVLVFYVHMYMGTWVYTYIYTYLFIIYSFIHVYTHARALTYTVPHACVYWPSTYTNRKLSIYSYVCTCTLRKTNTSPSSVTSSEFNVRIVVRCPLAGASNQVSPKSLRLRGWHLPGWAAPMLERPCYELCTWASGLHSLIEELGCLSASVHAALVSLACQASR